MLQLISRCSSHCAWSMVAFASSDISIAAHSVWNSLSFEVFKMAAGRHLGFDPTGNGAVRSPVPKNPTLEPYMKGIG